MQAMISTSSDDSLASEPNIRVASFFDHEEIGSTSAQGANSSFQKFMLQRLAEDTAGGDSTAFLRAMPKSYLVRCRRVLLHVPSSVELQYEILLKLRARISGVAMKLLFIKLLLYYYY